MQACAQIRWLEQHLEGVNMVIFVRKVYGPVFSYW